MKRYSISFVCLLISVMSFGQKENWGNKGDQWHYTWTEEYWPSKERPLPYKHTSVTISSIAKEINGETCNVYEVNDGDSCNPLIGTFYAYTKNRVTYYYNEDSSAFYPMYDFNMQPGDSLVTQTNIGLLITYLDSLGTMEVNDTALTVQYVHYSGTGLVDPPDRLFTFFPKNTIYNIEGIGNTLNFFPWWDGFCHNIRVINLRCFIGQDLEYHYSPEWVNQCDSTFFWGESTVSEAPQNQLRVYPNPAKEIITIANLNRAKGRIDVYSLSGKRVHSYLKQDGFTSAYINVSQFEKGLYLVVYRSEDSVLTNRLLVEE
ncbi:MAG: T9SS type A sorting domain-containing protein [Bacteroidia bacterium]